MFWKKKETAATETVSKAQHDCVVNNLRDDVRALSRLAASYKEDLTAARAEAEANKADAEELEQWRKYGQMRDPATGRLIPRVKAEVA